MADHYLLTPDVGAQSAKNNGLTEKAEQLYTLIELMEHQ